MSLYRVVLVGLAGVFTVGMTSLASAGGWGWGSGWGSGWGCGGCAAPSAAIVYAQPVAPLPAPVTFGCGCGHQSLVYAEPPIEPTPIAPAPIYVVNQGPEYEGPGITVPYHTWAPVSAYGPAAEYPYRAGYGLGYGYGPRYGLGYGYRHRYGLGYGYRHGLGFRYGFGPRPWRFGARFAYQRHFGGYPMHRWPMLRHHWYR